MQFFKNCVGVALNLEQFVVYSFGQQLHFMPNDICKWFFYKIFEIIHFIVSCS